MRFLILAVLASVMLVPTQFSPAIPARGGASPEETVFVLLEEGSGLFYHDLVEEARANGARVTQGFYPTAFIAHVSAAAEEKLQATPAVRLVTSDAIDPSTLGVLDDSTSQVIDVWNLALTQGDPPPPTEFPDDWEPPLTQRPTVEQGAVASSLPQTDSPGPTQTNEFMAGDVLAEVIFVESSEGAGNCSDASTEDWTDTRKTAVLSEFQETITFWTTRSDSPQLSFTIEARTLPTSCEPINHPGSSDSPLWIADVLTAMGCTTEPSGILAAELACLDDRRDELGFDWAFFFFVVDSENDSDGRFAPEPKGGRLYWAWAQSIGGPGMIMTSDTGGFGTAYMGAIAKHELGHVFYALDEYANRCNTTDRSGYLWVTNDSCNNGGITTDVSVMSDSSAAINPEADVSTSARAMVGWRNPSQAGSQTVVDVVRTSNIVVVPYAPDPSPGDQPSLYAYAVSQAYPPGSGGAHEPASISRIVSAEFQLDGGSFSPGAVVDGQFNEPLEQIRFTVPQALSNGNYSIGVRATNNFGHVSSVQSDSFAIQQTTPADSDGDSCTDTKELGPEPNQGGLRDPDNEWDYFNPTHDGQNRIDDVLKVVGQYFEDDGDPLYNQDTDRTDNIKNEEPWDLGPPNGLQRVDDILAIIAQYFHDC